MLQSCLTSCLQRLKQEVRGWGWLSPNNFDVAFHSQFEWRALFSPSTAEAEARSCQEVEMSSTSIIQEGAGGTINTSLRGRKTSPSCARTALRISWGPHIQKDGGSSITGIMLRPIQVFSSVSCHRRRTTHEADESLRSA